MRSPSVLVVGMAAALLGFGVSQITQAQPAAASPSQTAMASAAQGQKYLFILFYKQNDAATQAVRQTLETALAKQGGHATSVLVSTADPAEKAVVEQFGVSRSPMPLVLAVAPNGAITGGFPLKLTEQDIAGAFVSPALANCLKATQARKLVLLCVQPAGGSVELPTGAREFKADPRYGPATEVVTVRADDAAEAGLFKMLQLNPQKAVPLTALLVPPGRRLAVFEGAFSKEQLVQQLQAAQGGCCPGGKCGPGGCCPGGKCGPK